ncbi:DUF554 domain-containing protein [Lacticaseibacillus manihotivorans]|uniref:Transporter n=2 Tax=Lacticaseibacillus manihotivorans TaxID=88233 RepID=A0A0R1Q4C1_9LACO|nr:DUF554 domain-containing protein [Lacticaseibacillus manihotivorans]KRL39417.1 transporter [Lacticaseibacillus manihotivorans DSM 13343 = JCM 12514]QFQ90829.1 DUF554 family protein [Lacticaseibacillus manihotivorans]
MLGTLFNTAMIMLGSALGALGKRGIKKATHQMLMEALGICVIAIGLNTTLSHMPDSKYPVLFIASLAIGALIGSKLDLDGRFNRMLAKHEGQQGLAQGLATGILLYCIGTFSIVGPITAALKGDITMLLTNGMLDAVTSTILAASFGFGMIIAAPVLFCWQGAIYLIAKLLAGAISSAMITELSIVGGVLILASGISILGLKPIKTLNLLPALVVPIVVVAVIQMFS